MWTSDWEDCARVLLDSCSSLFLKLNMASEIKFTHCRCSDSAAVFKVTMVPFCFTEESSPGRNNGKFDLLRKVNLQFCTGTINADWRENSYRALRKKL